MRHLPDLPAPLLLSRDFAGLSGIYGRFFALVSALAIPSLVLIATLWVFYSANSIASEPVGATNVEESVEASSTTVPQPGGKPVDIEILGVEGDLQENVLLHLSLHGVARKGTPLTERNVRRLFKNAKEEAAAALQAFGYYEPSITTSLEEGKKWRAQVEVAKGPPTKYRDVRIAISGQGKEEPALVALLKSKSIRTGEVVAHDPYSALKTALRRTAYDLGYLDVEFTEQALRVYPQLQVADVHLGLATGKRYYFGPITIEQDILAPEFIERFIEPRPGDAFKSERLLNLQLGLTESNYFSQINVNVLRDEAQNYQIPVTIDAEPRKASRYSFSVGYGTDTGPRAGVKTDFRRVNRQGHRFTAELEVSEVQTSVAARYAIPIGDVRSESLDFTLSLESEDLNGVETQEYRLGTSLNQNRWGGVRRLSLELLHETWSFGDGPNNEATLLIPGFFFSYKHADDIFDTQRGYSYTVQFRGAAEDVASDVSFGQAVVAGRAVYPLAPRSRVLLRGEYGATITDAFANLPPSLRFFVGGSQSVRGYGYKDLSPRDAQNNRIGGKYFATASLELDYLVRDNMGVALFVDAGDATADPIEELKVGAGLGFRYRSPVGTFRLDIAHPFDDPDESFRVHISFGADL